MCVIVITILYSSFYFVYFGYPKYNSISSSFYFHESQNIYLKASFFAFVLASQLPTPSATYEQQTCKNDFDI